MVVFQQLLVKRLLARGCGGVYFFTMSMEDLRLAILKGIDVATHRVLSGRSPQNEGGRRREALRQVHWPSRMASYMICTAHRRGTMGRRWNALLVSSHSGTLALGEAGAYRARLLLGSRPKPCIQFPMIQGMAELQTALTELSRIFQAFLDGCGTCRWADELSGEAVYVEHLFKLPNARGAAHH